MTTVFDWLQIDLARCFSPGDVILARVISFGDNQTSFLLSTAEVVVVVIFKFVIIFILKNKYPRSGLLFCQCITANNQ